MHVDCGIHNLDFCGGAYTSTTIVFRMGNGHSAQSRPMGGKKGHGGSSKKKKDKKGGKGGNGNSKRPPPPTKMPPEPSPRGATGDTESSDTIKPIPLPERLVIIVGHSSPEVLHRRIQRAVPYLKMPEGYFQPQGKQQAWTSLESSYDLPVRYILLGEQTVNVDKNNIGTKPLKAAEYMHSYFCRTFGLEESSGLLFQYPKGISEFEQLKYVYEEIQRLYPNDMKNVPTAVVASSSDGIYFPEVRCMRQRHKYFFKTTYCEEDEPCNEKELAEDALTFWNNHFKQKDAVKLNDFVEKYKSEYLKEKDGKHLALLILSYTLPSRVCSTQVTKSEWESWVQRFGGVHFAFELAKQSCFDSSCLIRPYYHHFMGRAKAEEALEGALPGQFLIRVGEYASRFTLSYVSAESASVKHSVIYFDTGRKGYCTSHGRPVFLDLQKFVEYYVFEEKKIKDYIPSELSMEMYALLPSFRGTQAISPGKGSNGHMNCGTKMDDETGSPVHSECYGSIQSMPQNSTSSSFYDNHHQTYNSILNPCTSGSDACREDVADTFLPQSIRNAIRTQSNRKDEFVAHDLDQPLEALIRHSQREMNEFECASSFQEMVKHCASALVASQSAFDVATTENHRWDAAKSFWLVLKKFAETLSGYTSHSPLSFTTFVVEASKFQASEEETLDNDHIVNLIKDISSRGHQFFSKKYDKKNTRLAQEFVSLAVVCE